MTFVSKMAHAFTKVKQLVKFFLYLHYPILYLFKKKKKLCHQTLYIVVLVLR